MELAELASTPIQDWKISGSSPVFTKHTVLGVGGLLDFPEKKCKVHMNIKNTNKYIKNSHNAPLFIRICWGPCIQQVLPSHRLQIKFLISSTISQTTDNTMPISPKKQKTSGKKRGQKLANTNIASLNCKVDFNISPKRAKDIRKNQ